MNAAARVGVAVGYHLGTCDSTQPLAAAWAASRVDHPAQVAAVLTDEQQRGLGRGGRTWSDGPGPNLLLSVAIRDPGTDVQIEGLDLSVARALRDLLHAACGVDSEVVAPNDLVVGGRKLGGVLVDARTVASVVERVVVGIGCNLGGGRFEVDGRAATTVEAEGGEHPHPRELADQLVPQIARLLGSGVESVRWRQPARLWLALRDGAKPR